LASSSFQIFETPGLKQYFWLSGQLLLFMQRSTASQACCGVDFRGTGTATLQNPGMLALLNEQSAFVASSFGEPRTRIAATSSVAKRVIRNLSFMYRPVSRGTPGRSAVAIVFSHGSAGGLLAAA
jgi:hypothetical protein